MKKLLYVCVVIMLGACSSTPKIDIEVIDFSAENEVEEATDLFSVSYLKLETTDNCMLGGCSQCEEYDGRYFLLDNVVARALYVFDGDGRFISQVGSIGNGYGEYVRPFSFFFVNAPAGLLSVLDIDQQKLIDYDLESYRFVAERQLPFPATCIERLNTGNYVCYQNMSSGFSNSHLQIVDSTFKLKQELMPINFESGYTIGSKKPFYRHRGEIYWYSPYEPVLYRVTDDVAEPVFRLRFGDKILPPLSFLKKESANTVNYIPALMETGYVAFYEIYENDELICVPFYADKTMYYGFYDKVQGKSYLYTQTSIQESLQLGAFSSPVGTDEKGRFISLVRPGLLMQMSDDGIALDTDLKALVDKSTEDDNPILVFLTRICKADKGL